jgi:hypothetical protein
MFHVINLPGYIPEEKRLAKLLANMEKENLPVLIHRDGHEFHIICEKMQYSNTTGLLADTLEELLNEYIELTSA